MTIKHATASVFLFTRLDGGWRLGLIHHNRFGNWMLPGGHVEADENPAQAAVREVQEETGLTATLLAPPAAPLPAGLRDPVVPAPFWIVEEDVPGDREPLPHIHVDFLYVALADRGSTVNGDIPGEDLKFTWYTAAQLPGLDMFETTRLLSADLFAYLDTMTVPARTT